MGDPNRLGPADVRAGCPARLHHDQRQPESAAGRAALHPWLRIQGERGNDLLAPAVALTEISEAAFVLQDVTLKGFFGTFEILVQDRETSEVQSSTVKTCPFSTTELISKNCPSCLYNKWVVLNKGDACA